MKNIRDEVKNLFENDDNEKSDKKDEDLELLLDEDEKNNDLVEELQDFFDAGSVGEFEDIKEKQISGGDAGGSVLYLIPLWLVNQKFDSINDKALIAICDYSSGIYDEGLVVLSAKIFDSDAQAKAYMKKSKKTIKEGDSSVEEDNLFDKCQKSCDDSYEKCDASCEGNVECENDCMDVYNQCGANCEDLDNIDEAVDKALKEQSSDYDTIPIDDVRKEAIRSIKNMYNHTNEWSVRDTLIKFTEWGFYKGHLMVSIDEKIAKDICKQLIRFLKNDARKKDIWDVYDIVSHYASDEQRREWSEEALREQSDDYDDKILFWVNSEKLDELLHKHFSPGYEGDYYVLSDLDWQKFQDVASSNGFDQEEDYDEAYDLSGKLTQHGKFIREAKDPKAPRVMNIKWKRGGVLGPRASKIPEDVFKEFIDQGRDDSVILSWLSRKFRGIPVSFEWTTFKGSPIKEQRDEYGSVVFVIWDTDHVDFSRTENVGEVPPNKVPLPKDVYLEIEKQALDNWGENPETIEDEQASEDFINEKIKSWLEYEYHWIVKKWSWVPISISTKINEWKENKWKAPSGRTIDRKVTIRLLNMPQHSIISQADQDALGISRRDHETVRDALRRAEFEDTVKEWKDSGEPDINDIDDEKTRAREDDDSKMEHHDEEPTEISKEEFDQKAKSGKQIGRASERGHILTPRGDVVFHDGPTFLTNDRELVFYDDWSKKYYKIENFGDNLEELERKTDEYYEKEKEKRGFEDDEYYDDVAPHPEERRYDDVDEDNGEDIDEGKNMTRNLKTEVKKIFGEDKKMLKEGLEGHVNQVLDENGINPYDYWWSNGLNVKNEEVAKRIVKILDNSGEFGPTSFDKATGTISFGVHKSFESKDLKTEVKKLFQEDVEVNIPQRGDFAIAELSPQEKQEIVWTFAGECADVVEKMIESNVSIRGVYGYEVPRKAEVMHAKLFDFILAEIDRS